MLLKLDNNSAMAYIKNQLGWDRFEEIGHPEQRLMDVVPRKEHTHSGATPPGVLNCTADRESRVMRDRSDWK